MARADLILNLAKAGSHGDNEAFRRTLEAIIAEERAKKHNVLADRLSAYLKVNGESTERKPFGASRHSPAATFAIERTPERSLSDLILPEGVRAVCTELVEEQHRSDLLRTYQLEPRHRVLLAGPPGNGKTSLAEALARELLVPLMVVRYDEIIGSYLGETAQRLRRLFDFARSRQCVLFFDEFDAIGKERGDVHDTGEIKRVVSSLLLQMDALPSYVVVVVASNHPELLDRAVWRRFQLRLSLPQPSRSMRQKWFELFEERTGKKLGLSARTLADKLSELSFAELEEFGVDVLRQMVLRGPDANLNTIVTERLNHYKERYAPPSD